MYDLPQRITERKIINVIRIKTGANKLGLAVVLRVIEGQLSWAKIFFEDAEAWGRARENFRYFEVYEGSGMWSYGLPFGEGIKPSEYASISD